MSVSNYPLRSSTTWPQPSLWPALLLPSLTVRLAAVIGLRGSSSPAGYIISRGSFSEDSRSDLGPGLDAVYLALRRGGTLRSVGLLALAPGMINAERFAFVIQPVIVGCPGVNGARAARRFIP